MPLSASEKLGSYEILSPLGAGGMGEVYRARDTKLGREVAIKVLPEEFSQHPQKLARFEREARLLATLNHPGIATIYEVEESEGKPFLVMELVEGQTLADRFSLGPIPVGEDLEISRQIAEALEAAHEKGVIHRDLKPANIKVDPEGKVKVLDFGLAKAFADEVPESELSQSPTLSRDATRAGVILGTAAYMSPEQAKGKTVDKRSDIFSFGIVLFEMLTGKRAFAGEDVSEVLASIIKMEPDWKALPSSLDPRIRTLLRRCLTKDRKNRLRDIGDARFEIQEILTVPPVVSEAPQAQGRALWWGLLLVGAGLLGGLIVRGAMRTALPASPMVARFPLTLSGERFGGDLSRHLVAVSPDGTRLVYVGNGQLNLRNMGQLEAVPIRGTDTGPLNPFFSRDGEWVGFWAEGSLRKVSVTGGAPVTLCQVVVPPYGASWAADDTIVFGQGTEGILRVSANGGTPEVLVPMEPKSSERAQGPHILPDGKTLIFALASTASWDDARIVAQSLETGERKVLVEGGSDARYLPTGHLIYALGNTLFGVRFNLARWEVMGGPVPLVEGVRGSGGFPTGIAQASFSDSGSLVYVPGVSSAQSLVWVDRQGVEETLLGPPISYRFPRLAPDDDRLAVIGNGDVWIHHIARGTWTRLTSTENNDNLAWTADGKRVIFSSSRAGGQDLFWQSADGSDEATQLTKGGEFPRHPDSTSPDGRFLAFHEHSPSSGTDLWLLSLEGGDGEARPFLQTPFNERGMVFSPDGHWVAYVSDASGANEIYVQPFPGPGGTSPISTRGGRSPVWPRNSRELYYRNPSNEMMAVAISTDRGLTAGNPIPLFKKVRDPAGPLVHYDVTANGERFVVSLPEERAPAEIVVVLNWFEELKRLVPTN